MRYPIKKRSPCSVCGLDTLRHSGWFLVVENRWLDRLKILSWHSALASQKDVKSVCCRQHLKTRLALWLANCRFIASPFPASGQVPPQPSNASSTPSSPSEMTIILRRWSSSSSTFHRSPYTDFRSNKALAESSSASAPSTLANLSPSRRPSPAPLPQASSLFARVSPSESPCAFPPFPHEYSPSLSPSPPAAAVPHGSFRAPPVRRANNAARADARSNALASAHTDPDTAPPASGSPRTKSLPAFASYSANATPMAPAPSLPAPPARPSTPQPPPAASAPSFPAPPLAAPAR